MKSVLLENVDAVIFSPMPTNSSVLIEGENIVQIGEVQRVADRRIDLSGSKLYAGFIDIHIHGAVGIDVNEASTEGLLEVARFLAGNGVTAWVPTLVPDSDKNYRRVCSAIDGLMEEQSGRAVAQAAGVHYEGVFANEKMCGALRPQYFKRFTGVELSDLARLKNGIHMTTFSPEIEGGVALAAELAKNGWIASIGHTSAEAATLDEARSAGARHVTHFYNAMTGLHHRKVGVAAWALMNQDVTFDIIADGVHSDPSMLRFACNTKTADKVTLISDSVAPTGLGDGEFQLWGEQITVTNGRTQNERGSIAGSVITMLDAVMKMRLLGFSDLDVAKMSSLNPAKLLGIDGSRGSIEVGKRADLVALDDSGKVRMVMIGGEVV
ncbi:MAG: N-acetylglucosamine-6-phosphate deacetylase [Pyrinomonadaceae bacterium]